MKPRITAEQSNRSDNSFFTKFFGCFFRQHTGADDEFLCLDDDGKVSESTHSEEQDVEELFPSIQQDFCRIHLQMNDAFSDRSKLKYPAFKAWMHYLDHYSFILRDHDSYFQNTTLSPIPELELIQLMARENDILVEFSAKVNKHMIRLAKMVNTFPEHCDQFVVLYYAEQNKLNNVRISTNAFILKLETMIDRIQKCNEKISELLKRVNVPETTLPKPSRSLSNFL